MNQTPLGIVLLAFVIVFGIAFVVPLGFIWSLNTLFSFDISYTWQTWLAAFMILAFFGPKGNLSNKSTK